MPSDNPKTDPAAPAPTQNQDRLRAFFTGHAESTHPSRWDALWKAGDFLPWDRGYANPALVDALAERQDLLSGPLNPGGKRKRALVPGCGKGYDLVLLSACGYDSYGLEISENAVEAAREWLKSPGEGREGEYKTRDEKIGRGEVRIILGDFFKDEWADEIGGINDGFDLIYDCTFLSALPLSLRAPWALRMSQLLSPTGALLCLEFPTHKPLTSGGPPWALPSTVYVELFKRPGEDVAYDQAGKIVPDNRTESGKALVRVGYWKPARTHQVGIVNGEVKDWVSVWKHK